MLDIIITHYREPWEVCRKLFQTLDLQRRIRWEEIRVTVINDGGHMLPEEKLDELCFPVRQVNIPHGGISRARNTGIDIGTEPWIMFCDCDDAFYNIYALEDVMNVLHAPKIAEDYDMLWTKVWEESENGLVFLIPNYRVFVFCHGKVYNRAFLEREKLRFEESLTFNEDSCFNAVLFTRTTNRRIGEIKSCAPVYTWIRRANSVTTGEGAQDTGTYCNFRRNMIVTEENRLHRPEQYPSMVARTAVDAFYMINCRRISESCKQKILEEFLPWIAEHAQEVTKVDVLTLGQIREISKSELADGDEVKDGLVEILDWIKEVSAG